MVLMPLAATSYKTRNIPCISERAIKMQLNNMMNYYYKRKDIAAILYNIYTILNYSLSNLLKGQTNNLSDK